MSKKRKKTWRIEHKKQKYAINKRWRLRNRHKINKQIAEWRVNNPDKVKNGKLKCNYNIMLETYNKMRNKQRNKCRICERVIKLYVDHDHKTEKVRGLLCSACNMKLSIFDNKNNSRML